MVRGPRNRQAPRAGAWRGRWRPPHPAVGRPLGEREGNVLANRERAEERAGLKHHPVGRPPNFESRHAHGINRDGPARGRIKTGEAPQESRLPAAASPKDCKDLTAFHFERGALEEGSVFPPHRQVGHGDEGYVHVNGGRQSRTVNPASTRIRAKGDETRGGCAPSDALGAASGRQPLEEMMPMATAKKPHLMRPWKKSHR